MSPEDFPRFEVPGQEKPLETLRRLFWLHYPGTGPKATLWDEWLSCASLWPAVDTSGYADAFRQQWRQVLSARVIDEEGYVATHQSVTTPACDVAPFESPFLQLRWKEIEEAQPYVEWATRTEPEFSPQRRIYFLPFGDRDVYATIPYYDALHKMAQIEAEVRRHPEWNMPRGVFERDPQKLLRHAEEVKAEGNRLFWNSKTRRYAPIDADGKMHDYGYTFLNLEAIYYGFALPERARDVLNWVSGERTVQGDTSTGADIYYWRFAPRASSRRNIDYCISAWSAPESIPSGCRAAAPQADWGWIWSFSRACWCRR